MTLEHLPPLAPSLHADSDIGTLERVAVHRPGSELRRVTGDTAGELLFDAPASLDEAQAEHDELVAALGSGGAAVDEYEVLLAEALHDAEVRAGLLEALVEAGAHPDARAWLRELPAAQLASAVISGIAHDEAPPAGDGRLRDLRGGGRWLLPPLPNLMFTRDLFAVVGDGVARGCMRLAPRRGE